VTTKIELLSLAYQILTCGNLKLRKNTIKENISLERFFTLTIKQLQFLGATKEMISGFSDPIPLAKKEYDIALKNKIKIHFINSPSYPRTLQDIYDPPQCIYTRGDDSSLHGKTLGVVGSRKHSMYGSRIINTFFPEIIASGLTVVSGMAYGIDALAHQKAIALDGKTVGVNAGGLLHLYPAGNKNLFNEIISSGCIVSEFPLSTIPRPHYFPIRNRIIAGLSQKVWIVEAAERSGSLITARLAIESGKDVLVTPGPVDSPTSMGCNRLIKDGAKPILKVEDILEEYGIFIKSKLVDPICGQTFNLEETILLDLLKENGVKDIDFLVEKSTLPVNKVVSALNGLLLKKIVTTHSGGYWQIYE